MIEHLIRRCLCLCIFLCRSALIGAVFLACAPAINYLDPNSPKFTGRYAKGQQIFNDTLKVVTFNIEFARNIDRAIDELSTTAALKNADILLLQEMDEIGADAIAKALAYDYVYYPSCIHPMNNKNFGNAILSKWPISHERKILLPHIVPVRKTARIAVTAIVTVDKLELLVYSVHTATPMQGEEKRLAQAKVVLESIPESQPHVIIGGDFNTLVPESLPAHLYIFHQQQFSRASYRVGPTAKFGPIGVKLDHVFVKGLRAVAAGVVTDSRASDHLPVWVKLVVR